MAIISRTPTTTGTAMAAWSPELHDILSQSFSETVGFSPLVLLAAFSPVTEGESELGETGVLLSAEDTIEVSRVVGVRLVAAIVELDSSFDVDEACSDVGSGVGICASEPPVVCVN